MIRGHDFVVFSDDWDRHPFSCQHILRRFLPHNRVLWVNTIGMRRPSLTIRDARRSLQKVREWLGRDAGPPSRRPENLRVIAPVMIPFNDVGVVERWNRFVVHRKVTAAMREWGFASPVLVTTLPTAAAWVGRLAELGSVYYCVDDFTHWPGVKGGHIRELEERLLENTTLVCASSEVLCVKKSRHGRRPFLLPHGVDFEHFAIDRGKDTFVGVTRPIIGFFGSVGAWLDFDLLLQVARSRPDWSFVFLGPVDGDPGDLRARPNVFMPGPVTYDDLPQYAANFDVAIIPFVRNELTVSVNPLKLMEYLAVGLPVVSTPLPELERHSACVYLADGPAQFESAIVRALGEDSSTLRQRRRDVARAHSWDVVSEAFSRQIEETVLRS